ncbi:uncharacterized protein BP5553_02727 [Venustampulla echinocandica]|uniref:Uncharacterized protein n=1 Tax=Venustampulla echinocandica TaxID=2656787 RepID=A0A370TS78_9HELO|nr:uncharacterized protein BP5553_02727 [Venustampulla echinocandica]RDL38387.1 hypothetical protein BP5553_02727 [Venustampulla echinocandica]
MEPIPLRALTVLLNYEFMVSDPRFHGVRFLLSSVADATTLPTIKGRIPDLFKNLPATIRKQSLNQFVTFEEPLPADIASTTILIHPDAAPSVQALTFAQRELIYHETHSSDGCLKAIALFQFFFDLCSPGQKLSIQLTNEFISERNANSQGPQEPTIVDIHARDVLKFISKGPKLHSIVALPPTKVLINGSRENEPHAVLQFYSPRDLHHFIVDMTRMQYGEAGRRNLFLGNRP